MTNMCALDSIDEVDRFYGYQRRWKIEEYHKSLKNNVGIGKSPTKIARTQSCHVFASVYAKLESLKIRTNLNPTSPSRGKSTWLS